MTGAYPSGGWLFKDYQRSTLFDLVVIDEEFNVARGLYYKTLLIRNGDKNYILCNIFDIASHFH